MTTDPEDDPEFDAELDADDAFDSDSDSDLGPDAGADPGGGKGEDELAGLDEALVDVRAEVGRMTVTLGQLRRLGEGQVVEFDAPVEHPVILRVGSKAVATGELVDVGGRVGVRIVAMATQGE